MKYYNEIKKNWRNSYLQNCHFRTLDNDDLQGMISKQSILNDTKRKTQELTITILEYKVSLKEVLQNTTANVSFKHTGLS